MTEAPTVVTAFAVGYAAVLLAPGPNLFAIGAIAALKGLRAAIPLCAGIAVGASMLAVGICTAVSFGSSPAIEQFGRVVSVALLLFVAVRILLRQPPRIDVRKDAAAEVSARDAVALFLAGVSTAATNPITAAFFASHFLGALPDKLARAMVLGLVPCLSLLVGLTLCFVLSRPLVRRTAVAWHRPVRFAAAAVLAGMAMTVVLPLLREASEIDSTAAAEPSRKVTASVLFDVGYSAPSPAATSRRA